MVYFSTVLRDGIFEIDLSDSYTNISSIYALSNKRSKSNLDSALLWHCRLEHISKKRIEKLQHDGLLNSTYLRAFEKCIPCLSGNMARKPYTHQVERAKDLLGLIHTDVCGLFKIMSRQGASYFVTFTNNFSSYGYVYLLKHKHEVFETFKVFQKEVENQLAKTIKSLRSNLRGEYMSQDFLDHLKDHEIIAHRTPPYTSQHNCVSERRNRTLLDMENKLGELGKPANYKAALLDPEYDKWRNAVNVEMQSIKDNKVLDLVELPPNGKTIGSKWLFKKKTDMDGAVHTYKARLVAKGYTQTTWIDYEETFSPIADIRAIMILIAIAMYFSMKDLGEAVYILGIKIYRDRSWRLISLCQSDYTEKIFKRYHMENSKHGKAKYIAAFDASKEAVWVRKSISGLGVVPSIKDPIIHYLREVIEYVDVKLEKVHTDDNLADPFTKALAFPKHSEHTKNIGMLPPSSLM
uniref:Integrase catalytic domain-containing protein n=1 Tax=Tanacetum cinerariifolium TaxID=118510 RepID=A0A6L2KQS1_TANCI|nr:hypothetical protein [Tanacetum cinerariifolium]